MNLTNRYRMMADLICLVVLASIIVGSTYAATKFVDWRAIKAVRNLVKESARR